MKYPKTIKSRGLFRPLFAMLGLAFALGLTSCADENNLEQPTELQVFNTPWFLDVTWHKPTGDGVAEQYVFLHPLVLKEIAVTVSRDGVVNIISLSNGDFEQDIELDTVISSGVGGNEDTWLVASREGYVIAIDGKNRVENWRTKVPSEVLARPVIYEDTVIVRTVDGKLLSLDINSGKIRWQYERAIPDLTLRGTSEPVIARDRVFTGLEDGRLIALSPENGDVVWDIALAVPAGRSEIQRLVDIDGDAVLYGRILYAASFQGRMAAVDVSSGQFLWARDFSTHTGLVADNKVLYSSDENGFVWAIDRFNGATIWKQDKLAYRSLTRPTIIGDYIAVGDFEGYVHLLSRYDGHFIARYQLGRFDDAGWELTSGIVVPPIARDDNKLAVITRGGILYVLTLFKKDNDV